MVGYAAAPPTRPVVFVGGGRCILAERRWTWRKGGSLKLCSPPCKAGISSVAVPETAGAYTPLPTHGPVERLERNWRGLAGRRRSARGRDSALVHWQPWVFSPLLDPVEYNVCRGYVIQYPDVPAMMQGSQYFFTLLLI